jgi:glycosyltransferase involved in cell wall biosynthesis
VALAESVPPRLGIPPEKVDVIPRGRDPRRFPVRTREQRLLVRDMLGVSRDAPVILAVGRQDPPKGLTHLVDAIPGIAKDHPDVVVLIAGKKGSASAELRRRAGELRQDIRFLGHRSDVPSLLAAADVLCFPSEREGFGGVLLEAMAVGCPVVASAIPSSIELLGSGAKSVGIMTPVGDARRLGIALSGVLADPCASEPLSQRARARFERDFTIDAVAQRMAAFFTAIVGA